MWASFSFSAWWSFESHRRFSSRRDCVLWQEAKEALVDFSDYEDLEEAPPAPFITVLRSCCQNNGFARTAGSHTI